MKKLIYRIFIFSILIFSASVVYLSTMGIQTNRLNEQISNQVKKYNDQLDINLNKVIIILDPLKFKLNLKTIGAELRNKEKKIEFESVKSDISIKSLFNNQFSIDEINISTRSLEIKKLILFIRSINDNAQLYIVDKFVNNGFLKADINLQFNERGEIKNNYNINGFVKDVRIKQIKKINLSKIDFIFNINNKEFNFSDIDLIINKNNITFPKLTAVKENNKLLISGVSKSKETFFDEKTLKDLININIFDLKIMNVNFDSNNIFSFSIDNKYQIDNLKIQSELNLKNLGFNNNLKLKKIFPDIKDQINLTNHRVKIDYTKNSLNIDGGGDIIFQNENDKIRYNLTKKKNIFDFDSSISISKNQFELDILNFKKKKNSTLDIKFIGNNNLKTNKIFFKNVLLREEKNKIEFKNLILSNDYKIKSIKSADLNYQDNDNLKNNLSILRKNKNYIFKGLNFNATKIINDLLKTNQETEERKIFEENFKIDIKIDKVFLDKENKINNLNGYLYVKNNEIYEANLDSLFTEKQRIKFTINSTPNEKITTLYTDIAKPIVNRYEFIKGFEEGNLDFYSIKNNNISRSKLIIDNFKVQEIPVLAKLLTLASLQGIADLLTGEGIRFSDFEMKFSNENKLMKIEELYAIGPAISIMADGYIESNKLISLRGTLVPATTINRTIASIPLIGNILVGKKVGEGVFGVSFKIKGPPKDLKTSVNPVKTLTPRFITRTLEKIKKSN